MSPFSAIITVNSISFTAPDGRVHVVLSTDDLYAEVCEAVKILQKAIRYVEENGDADNPYGDVDDLHLALADVLESKTKQINSAGDGKVRVIGGVVYYGDEPVSSTITERILWGLSEGFDMEPYIRFLENCMENPSKRAVDEMYSFMEKHNMGITDDGYILGYKRVRENFKDIYSNSFDNSPGQVVEIRRNKVDDDTRQTCSYGLHFCAMHYLPSYGTSNGNKIVIVKVNPRDIVSVPLDYNHAKVRTCRYEVISEYTGSDKEDFLGTKAVWSNSDFYHDAEDDDDDSHYFCSDDDDSYDDESEEEVFDKDTGEEINEESEETKSELDSEELEDIIEQANIQTESDALVSSETERAVYSSLEKLSKISDVSINIEDNVIKLTLRPKPNNEK